MESKKNPKADLEKLRGTFLLGGLVLSLFIIFMIINLKFYDVQASELGQLVAQQEEEDIIPITEQNTPPPPPPPPPAAPEIIEIVEDDEEVEDIEIEDTEADAETVVEVFEQEEEIIEDEVFVIVENMPEFPGGQAGLQKYLYEHIKYPEAAKANGIQGRVFVTFTVGKDGKVKDVKILRGVHELLDKEAIRVVKSFPPYTPGRQRGKAVNVSFNLPINFTLK
ncbi:MAG: energy transducer TonB [Vicingus serpentipes]|nr:energy transducer TonB [Vicingus serpentipes]